MNADGTLLRILLHGTTHYMVPLFQRTYSWEKHEWQTLWTDVVETYETEISSRHFLGSIVCKSLPSTPEGVSRFLLIDGQQRLTTLTLVLAALRDTARPTDPKLADKLHELYLTNEYASSLDRYKVLPTQADRDAYFTVIDGDTGTNAPDRVRSAYRYFRGELVKPAPDGAGLDFRRSEQVLMSGFELVSITLGEHDNEYRIFESLNAKGAPLTQADLLRNYLFMRIPIGDQDEIYRQYWLPMQTSLGEVIDDYFRYAYMSTGQFVREGDVYQEWKKVLDLFGPTELREQIATFAREARFFLRIAAPEHEPHPGIAARLRRLNRWGGQTMYPFLLNVYRWYDRGEVDATGVVAIVHMIESFLVRRLFADVPTNALNRLFLRLAQQLPLGHSRVDGTHLALSEPGRRWPREDEFRSGILNYPLYLDSRPEQRRMILETLEASFAHKEPPSFNNASIEHVMPQTLTPAWRAALGDDADAVHRRLLHVLGNLTLSAYNAELSNDPFEEKRHRLASSNFALNKEIADQREWTGRQIIERGGLLADRAVRLWPPPVNLEGARPTDGPVVARTPVSALSAPKDESHRSPGQVLDPADRPPGRELRHRGDEGVGPAASTDLAVRNVPTPSHAAARRAKTLHHVALKDLIDWQIIDPPFPIRKVIKGQSVDAHITDDGAVVWDGRRFDTLSAAARAASTSVTGHETELNGWMWWTFRDNDGQYKPLTVLRDRYYTGRSKQSR